MIRKDMVHVICQFSKKGVHNETPGIEVSNGYFSQNKVTESETTKELRDCPITPVSVIRFERHILINSLFWGDCS